MPQKAEVQTQIHNSVSVDLYRACIDHKHGFDWKSDSSLLPAAEKRRLENGI